MASKSIGEKYIDFLKSFIDMSEAQLEKEVETLFAPDLKELVNLSELSKSRVETLKQMKKVKADKAIKSIMVHEYFETADKQKCAILLEILYTDGEVDSVISIVKANTQGLIGEINQVFGQKDIHEWGAH